MSIGIAKSTFANSWLVLVAFFGSTWSHELMNNAILTKGNPFTYRSSNTTTNPAYIRHRRAASCYAPPQPDNGEVKLNQDSCRSADCKIPEGTAVGLGETLIYRCNSGYKLDKTSDEAYCISSGKWSNSPRCIEITCPALSSVSKIATCYRFRDPVNCGLPAPPGTEAQVFCRPGYRKDSSSLSPQKLYLTCEENGRWSPEDTLRCLPTCGQAATQQTPFIVNGTGARLADFPWHATLYMLKNSQTGIRKEFICGATIVQANLLLTAAHCVFDEKVGAVVDSRKLLVLTGNLFRDYDYRGHNRELVKRGEVETIYVPCDYFGLSTYYTSDIALLKLKTPFELSSTLLPACLSDDEQLWDEIIATHSYGKVAGFGRTATSPTSGFLQSISVPYVSYNNCRGTTNGERNKMFIARDKFCAGYLNGSAVCDGDSGGGIAFELNDKWYVMGVVSVGLGVDTNNSERKCDNYSYTLYTRLRDHIRWIQHILHEVKSHLDHLPCATLTQTRSPSSTTTPSPPKVVSNPRKSPLCIAPEQPLNGQWKLHRSLCKGLDGPDLDCEIPSGAELPIDSELIYSCDPGYKNTGGNLTCLNPGPIWYGVPNCIKE